MLYFYLLLVPQPPRFSKSPFKDSIRGSHGDAFVKRVLRGGNVFGSACAGSSLAFFNLPSFLRERKERVRNV